MDIAKKTSSTKVLHGGNQPKGGDYKEGFFYEPTLLSGVPVESPVCQEEVFGPVACAIPFKNFDEVMRSANDTPFGLSAVLWTQNLSRALQFVDEIEAGFVQVNQCAAPRLTCTKMHLMLLKVDTTKREICKFAEQCQ